MTPRYRGNSAYCAGVSFRTRVHHLLEGDLPGDRAGAFVRLFMTWLILGNVASVVLETVPWILEASPTAFRDFERASIAIFSIEYALRLWTAPEHRRAPWPRLRQALSPGGLVDLASVLPGWLPMLGIDLRSLRLLRLLRVVRVGKLGRYSLAVQTLGNVLRSKGTDLLSLLVTLLVLLVVTSTIMFWLEHEAQPQVFSSIPATMWWGIVTLTTIGYGDMSPVTNAGRAFGGVVAVMGIGMFALPAGLLGAAFVDELGKVRDAQRKREAEAAVAAGHAICPHCGKVLPADGGAHPPASLTT